MPGFERLANAGCTISLLYIGVYADVFSYHSLDGVFTGEALSEAHTGLRCASYRSDSGVSA